MTGTSCPKWISQDPYGEFILVLHFLISNYRPTLMWFLPVQQTLFGSMLNGWLLTRKYDVEEKTFSFVFMVVSDFGTIDLCDMVVLCTTWYSIRTTLIFIRFCSIGVYFSSIKGHQVTAGSYGNYTGHIQYMHVSPKTFSILLFLLFIF